VIHLITTLTTKPTRNITYKNKKRNPTRGGWVLEHMVSKRVSRYLGRERHYMETIVNDEHYGIITKFDIYVYYSFSFNQN